jgi:hypothetical protein
MLQVYCYHVAALLSCLQLSMVCDVLFTSSSRSPTKPFDRSAACLSPCASHHPEPKRMGPPPGSTVLPEQGTLPVAGPGKKPLAAANSAAVASTTSTLSAAPPTSVLTKRPASMTGLASTSPAKKLAFTSPYHKFCQELRPLLPATLRNSEREKLLGVAWKVLSGTENPKLKGNLMPILNSGGRGGWHEGTRVAWAHEPAPLLQLAAPPAPQLQLTMAQQLQFSAAVMLPPPPAPTAAPVLWATRVLPIGMPVGVPVPLQDLRLPPLLPCMPRLSYPAAPPPAPAVPSRVPKLLTAAAAHRTFVELDLWGGEQLAELMEEQMTGEDAIDIAISLGMPH